MKGVFDHHYQIDIVSEIPTSTDNEYLFRITYSELEYPDFFDYIKNKLFKQDTIFYQDEKNEGFFLVLNIVIMRASLVTIKNKIRLDKKIYGDIVDRIPLNQRDKFILHQNYGKMKIRRANSAKQKW